MGTPLHVYDSFHSLERILEGNQELSKEVLKKFGGHVECNGCNNYKSLWEHFGTSALGSNNFLQPLQVIIHYKNHG